MVTLWHYGFILFSSKVLPANAKKALFVCSKVFGVCGNAKATVTPNTDILRTAPDGPGPPRIKSLSIRGGPGPSWVFFFFFFAPTVEICRRLLLLPAALRIAPAPSRNNYGWGRWHHEITTVLLRIVMDRHGSTTDHPRTVPAALCTTPSRGYKCRCRYGWCRYRCGVITDDASTVLNPLRIVPDLGLDPNHHGHWLRYI